jgi:hypothetical protein
MSVRGESGHVHPAALVNLKDMTTSFSMSLITKRLVSDDSAEDKGES